MQSWKLTALTSVIMYSIWVFDYSGVKCARIQENILHEIEEELSNDIESCLSLIKLMENSTNVTLEIQSDSILVGPVVKSFNCSASLNLWNERIACQDDDAIVTLEELLNNINRTDLRMLLHEKHEGKNSSDFEDFVEEQNDDFKSTEYDLNLNIPFFENGLNYRYVGIILLLIVIIVIQTYRMSVEAQSQIHGQGNPVATHYVSPYECDVEIKSNILERKYSDSEISDDDDDDETTIHFVRTASRQRYQVKDNEPLLHH